MAFKNNCTHVRVYVYVCFSWVFNGLSEHSRCPRRMLVCRVSRSSAVRLTKWWPSLLTKGCSIVIHTNLLGLWGGERYGDFFFPARQWCIRVSTSGNPFHSFALAKMPGSMFNDDVDVWMRVIHWDDIHMHVCMYCIWTIIWLVFFRWRFSDFPCVVNRGDRYIIMKTASALKVDAY